MSERCNVPETNGGESRSAPPLGGFVIAAIDLNLFVAVDALQKHRHATLHPNLHRFDPMAFVLHAPFMNVHSQDDSAVAA
jgi:hypothetical protein